MSDNNSSIQNIINENLTNNNNNNNPYLNVYKPSILNTKKSENIIDTSISNNDNTNPFLTVYRPTILDPNKKKENNNSNIIKRDDDEEWTKIEGWYNELNFYSKVFQYFGEIIKHKEGMFGWWIIMISSFSSFITLFSLDPFNLTEIHNIYYNWIKSVILAVVKK